MDNSVRARGIRPAAVAGAFYPEEPSRLSRMLDSLLETAAPPAAPLPKAIIAPHAGYQCSGPIAASAFVSLRGRTEVRRSVCDAVGAGAVGPAGRPAGELSPRRALFR